MAEIVNCPFCGGIATVGGLVPWVECQSCGASGPQKTTEAEAITAWNTRHGAGDAEDSARLDWLERHLVEVREPLRYGSAHMFYALQTNDEGEPYRSDLRARVDAARAGERGVASG